MSQDTTWHRATRLSYLREACLAACLAGSVHWLSGSWLDCAAAVRAWIALLISATEGVACEDIVTFPWRDVIKL